VTGHKIEKRGADKALPVAGRASRSASRPREDYAKGKTPIILVPAGFGSKVLFNMYNAAKFLQEETLVTWDTYHKRGDKKAPTLSIKRRYKRSPSVKYRVTDEVPSRDSKDWQCVVAVFVSGKAWQFKDWPFKGADEGDLVETFAKVRGFYAQYDTETPADVIKTWNVQTLRFQKNVRHGDRAQFEQFWNEVDKHLELNRSQLKY
jgi:parafibromin